MCIRKPHIFGDKASGFPDVFFLIVMTKIEVEKEGYRIESIVGLHRNHFGEIISFITSEGRVISYRKALLEAESGLLAGIQMQEDGNGNAYLSPAEEESFDHYPNLF